MRIQFEHRSRTVQGVFERLQRLGVDLHPFMRTLGRKLRTRVQLAFRSGRDPYGTPWRPLKFRSGQPLRDTGQLANSIGFDADADSVTIGTNVRTAPVHQFGATIEAGKPPHIGLDGKMTKGSPVLIFRAGGGVIYAKRVVIPPRPFLPAQGLPDEWEGDIVERFNAMLDAAIKGSSEAA